MQLIKWAFIVLIMVLAGLCFIPGTYVVLPFKERVNTQYWELSTGSRIGYTKIEGAVEEKRNPVIYLHGGPGGMIKDKAIEALKPLASLGFELYFYDQIGSGHSKRLDNIAEYSVVRHLLDLEEIIKTIGAEKVILIAHSWGTMLAMQYAQKHPDKLEKMVFDGPGPLLPINRSLINDVPPDSLHLREPAFSNKDGNNKAYNLRSKLILKWAYLFHKKLASDKESDNFFTHLNEALSRSTSCDGQETSRFEGGGGYYAHIMTLKSFDAVPDEKELIKNIQIPVLIIRGQCDNQKWGFTKEYLDLLPNAKLAILENSGHELLDDHKEQYIQLVREFLDFAD
ncbi:MAG: alpha/beta fold hydrolase [Saprospiraceae bacterium]|nr:alpha/beta fold hydrolase [Saprospiraceae bacterium]MCB9342971.1 alpha/beta fold hydrolase [Lewinellaceae bacterium]